jgi:hypothetical protein
MGFLTVNWLSVVIAAAAAWLFGGVYYSALGKVWMAAQGKTMEQCQAEMAAKSTAAKVAPFVIVFVAEIVMAWATYGILLHLNGFTLRGGLISAAALWFGYVLTTIASNYAFHGKKPALIAIDSGGWLGAMLIIGAIVGWMGP